MNVVKHYLAAFRGAIYFEVADVYQPLPSGSSNGYVLNVTKRYVAHYFREQPVTHLKLVIGERIDFAPSQ